MKNYRISKSSPIVILTGAGISAESGIRTFRDHNGLWENHRIEDVATPEAFARNPHLVHQFYNLRRQQLKDPQVQANRAHTLLAEMEKNWQGPFLLVTQNVDDLHERAGSQKLLSMHGKLNAIKCNFCPYKQQWAEALSIETVCPRCKKSGGLRPDIVWFGEMPYFMDEIYEHLENCEVFVSIGTSGNVYPAAGFVSTASSAYKIEINPEATPISPNFDLKIQEVATIGMQSLINLIRP